MQMESGSMERGRMMAPESLGVFPNMSLLNEEILKQENEISRLHSEMRVMAFEVLKRMLNVSDNLSLQAATINAALDKQGQQMGILEQRLKAIESEIKKLALDVTGLSPSVVAIDKNLKEVRNLNERIAEKSETLSEEFIERHVKDPLIEHLMSLYNSIRQMAQEDNNRSALLEQARQLFEAQGTRIIEPETGSAFNPREHMPVRRMLTSCGELQGKISRVFSSGLGRNGRVVKHAMVEIFNYKQDVEKTKGGE